MIKYLAYYSIGGYKDIYVGSTEVSGDEEGKLFYSTFLQPWLKGQLDIVDEKTCQQLEILKSKPLMEVLTKDSVYKIPSVSKRLVTHAGYLLACCSLSGKGFSVAIRDIPSSITDEFGRSTPFMMQFICDEAWQADSLFNSFRLNLQLVKGKLSKLFSYNPMLNCIQFDLSSINSMINDILTKEQLVDKDDNMSYPIRHIMLSGGVPFAYCVKELGFETHEVYKAYDNNGNLINSKERVIDENERSNQENVELSKYHTDKNAEECDLNCFMKFLTWLKSHTKITYEDKQDLAAIKLHILNILKRKHIN